MDDTNSELELILIYNIYFVLYVRVAVEEGYVRGRLFDS